MLEVSLLRVGTAFSVSKGMRGEWFNDYGKKVMSMSRSSMVRLFAGVSVR